ncbi:hypothetical protein AURDEDRAFT_70060 [Auricularia subglabra TFB-10046 SS5]|nr:hypothetical protein AURDEDRAFT_70060 [Auricularia subglabra TFB-10046 SS5]
MDLEPVKIWLDELKTSRCYAEANSGDWWWELQKRLPEGALVVPVIIATDKTQLSAFSGDKSAYPVYLTIGNIHGDLRRQASSRATVLIGYLPVSKFEIWATAEGRSAASHRLFHHCMSELLEPLISAGRDGVDVLCCDGFTRKAFMVLMSYIADYPEQCLVACCKQNQCPACLVEPKQRGAAPQDWPFRSQPDVAEALKNGPTDPRFDEFGLKDVVEPFWAALPHTDIFHSFTPDILHELHKGAFGDHLLKWCIDVIGADEVDRRMKCLPRHPTLRHFGRGISVLSQWTGKEYREVEKVFAGLVAGHAKPELGMAARALVDFIYSARMPVHNDDTLRFMDDALNRFHEHKKVFLETGTRPHFNIIKLHKLQHYVPHIRAYGAAASYSSEAPERMHIDYCKEAYRASNRRDYLAQMTVWLRRQDAVNRWDAYLRWCQPRPFENDSSPPSDSGSDAETESDDSPLASPSLGDDDTITHRLPLHPSYRNRSIAQIDEHHAVPDFLPMLNEFLRSISASHPLATATDLFDVYKRVMILQMVGGEQVQDVVRATPSHGTSRGRTTTAFFDTALIGKDGELTSLHHSFLADLQAVRVRVIFEAPVRLGLSTPLAFVEYFTPFRSKPSKDVGFLWTAPSRRRGEKRTGVIRLDSVVCSCHLTPKFPSETPEDWSTDNIFEVCPTFHLNEHLNDRMYGTQQQEQDVE